MFGQLYVMIKIVDLIILNLLLLQALFKGKNVYSSQCSTSYCLKNILEIMYPSLQTSLQ